MNGPQLLRSVGLVADGPVVWGRPIRSRKPGIYVVELPERLPRAPVDHGALRRWLERVPTLLMDGARPTPHELAARLGAFWLPDETVLYVGRSTASLGGRVAAFYQTPLGDPRPHAGGHWLKTLSVLDRLTVWWSETDAPEEYEDALLNAFAESIPEEARAALHDPSIVLPFANIASATGARKAHGISGSTLATTTPDAAPPTARKIPAAAARARRAAGATSAPGTVLDGRAAQPRTRAKSLSARSRAANEPVRLTRARLDELRTELKELTEVRRPEIVARVKSARELGDLRENADYEAARNEQSFNEGRIQALESLLRSAVELEDEDAAAGGEARIGSTVVVESGGSTSTYRIVAPNEASPGGGRISYVSPIGQALMGRRAGDEVTVRAPAGEIAYRIVEVS